jgi:aspartyl aminopeptidase
VTFLNKAVSPYHAVDECSRMLNAAGFKELKETEQWKIEPLNKYYLTRNKSTIIAFAVGGKFRPGNGVAMIAAHTDSPNLRVKPVSKLTTGGCLQVGVMTYGGGIWRTWFDRDLTVAGRVIVKGDDGKIRHELAHIERPILCIPNLCIHLDRETNEKFNFNKEDHLKPILATQVVHALNNPKAASEKGNDKVEEHHPAFLQAIAESIKVQPSSILDFDLCLIDTQPAQLGGLYNEFVFGPRLDNLVGTYTSITALIKSVANEGNLQNDPTIRLAACFDNEECGSESAQGAQSSLTEWILRRLQSDDSSSPCAFEQSISRSFLISADQAHAVHPNYKSKHEDNHSPAFHKGVVLKINPNQRYATTTITSSILKQIADRAQVPLQKFVVRNDTACGSTVGPIMSAKLGLQTVDVGTPQLAMHSAREMACTTGIYYAQELYTKFFENYDEVQKSFNI